MKRARRLVPLSTLALALAVGACGGSEGPSQPSPEAQEEKGPFEPYSEVVKDVETQEGLFTVHVKRDLTMLMEVSPDQLDTDYGLITHFSQGTGVYNLHDGLSVSGTRLIRFERHGDRIYLVERNPLFTAEPGSNMARSLEENTGHSILAAFDVEAQHDSTEALVIDVTGLFVGDFEDLAENLGNYHGNNRVSFDGDRSYLKQVMVFPENVEIDAMLTFEASGRPTFSSGAGVSDYRSIPVGLRYSVFALPEEPMKRRLADDRLGYFISAQRNFSMDKSPDPYVRYVNRWRLEKADPDAAMSEPVEPIVYYVDRSVPEAYRPYVKQGVEAWNKAFEAAGFRNGIVAMDPPDDPEWSAEDVRYSTVRWTAAHEMGYAIGPSQVDPRTGEILNADILISSTFVTGWSTEWQEYIGDAALAGRYPEIGHFGGLWGRLMAVEAMARELPAHQRERLCVAAMGKAHQLGFQHAALSAMGVIDGTEPMPEDFLGPAIRDLVMHEVGHTLGLRHNFKASAVIPFDRLNDESFTRENGVYVSVMDYAPTNIATDRSEQGHYVNPEVGAYDVWVIQYGYMEVPGASTPEAELPALRDLAGRASSDPLLAYNTDEDTHLGPLALDPLSNTWDLSTEPMTFARSRAELVAMVKPELEARLIEEGEGYQRLRSAVPGLIYERYGSLLPVTKAVGGMYFHRDHKGQPNARIPFAPVGADRQREALAFVIEQAFAPDAFAFEAETLNKLPPDRWGDWAGPFFTAPIDYPIHSTIAAVQNSLLGQLMHNGRLIRMIDNEVRMLDGEPYTVAELFGTLTDGIWTEAGWGGRRATDVDSYRRNLQRLYVTHLIDKALDRVSGPRSSFNPSTPEDARSLARHELQRLSDRLGQVMNASSLDRVTRAHFAETRVRIDQALDADLILENDG